MDDYDFSDVVPFEKSDIHSTQQIFEPQKSLPGDAIVLRTPDGFTAYTEVQKAKIYFRFSELSFGKQSVECVLHIELESKEGYSPPFSQRIDLRSASARKSLATDLNSAYGDKKAGFNWVLLLNVACNQVIDAIQKEQQPVNVENEAYEDLPFLASPFLQQSVSNLLFAQSEAGKTWFALRLALSLATGDPFLTYPMPSGKKTLYLDYEDSQRTFTNRLYNICAGTGKKFKEIAPFIHYYKPTGSFRANTEQTKSMIERLGYDLLIIDAGGDAAGGSPSDEEKVLDLFNALEEIRCTKLILHHEPKYVQSEAAAFYGSMYWKARSRVAWRLQVESEDSGKKLIKASIQKRSNLPYFEPIYYNLEFDALNIFEEHEAPMTLAVRMTKIDASVLSKEKPTEEAIIETLEKEGELTEAQIASFIGRERSVVNRALRGKLQHLIEQKKKGKSTIWRLK